MFNPGDLIVLKEDENAGPYRVVYVTGDRVLIEVQSEHGRWDTIGDYALRRFRLLEPARVPIKRNLPSWW